MMMPTSLLFEVIFIIMTIYGSNATPHHIDPVPPVPDAMIKWEDFNRDGQRPNYPAVTDLRRRSINIAKAHEVLQKGLQDFLDLPDADLGTYLTEMANRREPYVDEYGNVIRVYKKIFNFISDQHSEIQVQNYAVGHFDKDKLELCSAARFLSHQPTVKDRHTIMKRMGDALKYKCHPCTPYRTKEHSETVVPDTENIPDDISPEEILNLCNPMQGRSVDLELVITTSTEPAKELFDETTEDILFPIIGDEMLLPDQEKKSEISTSLTSLSIAKKPIIMQEPDPEADYGSCRHSYLKNCMSMITCDWFFRGEVFCDNKVSIEEIQEIFQRTSRITFDRIKLIFQRSEDNFIPPDLIANKKAIHLFLDFDQQQSKDQKSWKVDPDAFRSSRNYTEKVEIYGLDCSHFDFGFLSGFNRLENLTMTSCFNMQYCLPKLPPLPSLSIIDFSHVTGLADVDHFPSLVNGLKYATFIPYEDDCEIWDDGTVRDILNWMLDSSHDTLEFLTLKSNKFMTVVPDEIPLFTSLKYLNIEDNNIHAVKKGALSFSSPVTFLNIHHNKIRSIDPGAFKGDFSNAQINMAENFVFRFDESVFGPILKQMDYGLGLIEARGNAFKCDDGHICRLSWLFKKEYKHMLGDKIFGRCANETRFTQLHSEGVQHCPVTTKQTNTRINPSVRYGGANKPMYRGRQESRVRWVK